MHVGAVLYTRMTAQECANVVAQWLEFPSSEFFGLDFSTEKPGAGDQSLWVRPIFSVSIVTTSNNTEVITLETDDGRRVLLTIPLENREFQPATLVVEERATPDQQERSEEHTSELQSH